MGFIVFCMLIGVGGLMYFLPSIVGREKRNIGAIFMLNLFLGWTLVGWVVALVWAMTVEPPLAVLLPVVPAAATHSAFCTGCGAALQPGSRFCAACGRPG